MHQEKQHKSTVDENVHDPPEKVLSQYPELEENIKDKNLHEGKYFDTEKC
jgi:hypothetical protein